MTDVSIPVEITKRALDEDQRLVGGFAYVSKKDGEPLFDTQGDSVETSVLREAVHEFVKSGRTLGIMHIAGDDGKPVSAGEIVEMAVFGDGFIPPGMPEDTEGLWIVAKVADDDVWGMVKAGLLGGFSIGGKGVREEIQ